MQPKAKEKLGWMHPNVSTLD